MEFWQRVLIFFCLIVNLIGFIKGFYETKYKNSGYGLVRPLTLFGIFVWGDTIVLGPLWLVASLITLLLEDWYLFLFFASVYWVVRSFGETLYWFLQQFTSREVNKPESLIGFSIYRNDSLWFGYQILWQAINVLAIIASVYFGGLWLSVRF